MSSATKAPGAEGPGDWAALSPQEIVRRTRCEATVFGHATDIALWRECCDLILNRLGPASIASAPTPLDRVGEEVAERIVQRLLNAKYDLRDVAGRFEATDIVREEVGRQTFAPWVRSLDDARFTENEVAPIKERLERAFYDAGGFHGQIVEYAARTALPVVLELLASAPAPSDPAGAGGDLGEPSREAVEMMAEHLHEEHEYDRQWVWPAHADDDGYRGGTGYVRLTPPDIQARMREMAHRVLIRANQITHRSGQLVASTPGQKGAGGDLVSYLHRQWAWSKETFGPALRTKGIVQHITKELREIEAEPHDLAEWVDVIILAMDGFWRHGGKPEDLLPAMQAKQDKNFARQWPDWRTMGEDQAIEHDRSSEGSTPAQTSPSTKEASDA